MGGLVLLSLLSSSLAFISSPPSSSSSLAQRCRGGHILVTGQPPLFVPLVGVESSLPCYAKKKGRSGGGARGGRKGKSGGQSADAGSGNTSEGTEAAAAAAAPLKVEAETTAAANKVITKGFGNPNIPPEQFNAIYDKAMEKVSVAGM